MGPEVPDPHLLDAVHLQVLQPVVQPPLGHRSQAARQRCSGIRQARKEASSFLAALGLDKPAEKDEWRTVLREMGTFLATKVFLTNCPAPVMEMPVAPVHDSKEAMRFRAMCDERITIPLDALKQFPEVRSKLVGQLPQSAMVSPRPREASAADLPEVQLLWSTLVLAVCLHGA